MSLLDRRDPRLRHLPFGIALLLGAVLRLLVCIGYRPALIYTDSLRYLEQATNFYLFEQRPPGYPAFLWAFVRLSESRTPIVVTQHLLGLGLAVVLYTFLRRRGLPGWGATLAVLPVLLDPLQLVLEHFIASDVLFEVLLVGACLLLLWRSRPSTRVVVLAGLLVAASVLTRSAATLVVPVFVAALVVLRTPWWRLCSFVVACAVPLAGYAIAFHSAFGVYAVSDYGPRFLYARMSQLVRCAEFPKPVYEQDLCPGVPPGQRRVVNSYIWGKERWRQFDLVPPNGMTQLEVVRDFDKRVVRNQTADFVGAVMGDFLLGFSADRSVQMRGNPSDRWLFEDHYWALDWQVSAGFVSPVEKAGTSSYRPVALFLTGYRRVLWTPGPLLLGLGVVAVIGLLGPTRRARLTGDRVAVGLLLGACLVPLLTGAAVSGFSWRYQLPQLPMIPAAGALAIGGLRRGRAWTRGAPPSPYVGLDRVAHAVGRRLPGSAGDRLSQRPALVAVPLSGVVSVLIAVACGVLLARSRWLHPSMAHQVGAAVGLLALAVLLVSWARGRADSRWLRERPRHAPGEATCSEAGASSGAGAETTAETPSSDARPAATESAP